MGGVIGGVMGGLIGGLTGGAIERVIRGMVLGQKSLSFLEACAEGGHHGGEVCAVGIHQNKDPIECAQ